MDKIKEFLKNVRVSIATEVVLLGFCIFFIIDKFLMPLGLSIISEQDYEADVENAVIIYDEVIEAYHEYNDIVASYLTETVGNDLIPVYAYYLTMQDAGFLSHGIKFYNIEGDYQIDGNYGINVVLGKGVCRHTSENLYHVLNKMGFKCERIIGELYRDKKTGEANHMLVYVYYEDKVYLLDPTNKTIFIRGKDGYIDIRDTGYYFVGTLEHDMTHDYDLNNQGAYFILTDRESEMKELHEDFIAFRTESRDHYLDFAKFESSKLSDIEEDIYNSLIEIDGEELIKGLG